MDSNPGFHLLKLPASGRTFNMLPNFYGIWFRDCPPESREAVASLMFAAARFADLRELCELRCIFTQRYGSSMESAINREVPLSSLSVMPEFFKLVSTSNQLVLLLIVCWENWIKASVNGSETSANVEHITRVLYKLGFQSF